MALLPAYMPVREISLELTVFDPVWWSGEGWGWPGSNQR